MPQDDVTDDKPLRGGRQKANHIQVHRVEFGLWERKNLVEPISETLIGLNDARKIATIAAPFIAAAGVYTAYKIGQAAYTWVDDELVGAVKKGWEYFVYGNDGKFFFWDKDGNFSI